MTKSFYENWDDEAYRKYMEAFSLDEEKTPGQLSEGMKVKLNLTLALSHRAELLILDEPTSGLDPVSRDELLDIFRALRAKGVSILFSTFRYHQSNSSFSARLFSGLGSLPMAITPREPSQSTSRIRI